MVGDERKMEDMERFLAKIKGEITEFERGMLTKKPEEIYYRAYEIDCMNDIYECMSEICRELDAHDLEKLSDIPELLPRLYQSWLKYGDVCNSKLRGFIEAEIKRIRNKKTDLKNPDDSTKMTGQ